MAINIKLRNFFYQSWSIISQYGGAIITIFSVLIAVFSWIHPKGKISIDYVFAISFFSLSIIYVLVKYIFISAGEKSELPIVRNILSQVNSNKNEVDVRFFLEPSETFKRGLLVSVYYKEDNNDMELFIGSGFVEAITEKKIIQVLLKGNNIKLLPDKYLKIITPSSYCLKNYIVKPYLFDD